MNLGKESEAAGVEARGMVRGDPGRPGQGGMGSMALRGKRKAGDEDEHLAQSLALAMLELIFLFFVP